MDETEYSVVDVVECFEKALGTVGQRIANTKAREFLPSNNSTPEAANPGAVSTLDYQATSKLDLTSPGPSSHASNLFNLPSPFDDFLSYTGSEDIDALLQSALGSTSEDGAHPA